MSIHCFPLQPQTLSFLYLVYLMAASDIRVTFLGIYNNSWYFEEDKEDKDVEEDAFQQSEESLKYHIKSMDNKFLILTTGGNFQFKNLTAKPGLEHKFNIQIYKDSDLVSKKGRAVMLFANKYQQKMVACCRKDSYQVYAEAMELPKLLNEKENEALFYMTKLSATDKFMFESTLHPRWFLGFEPDEDNPCRHKLVLIQQDTDETDASLSLVA